jgi:hypothetical protein
MKGKSIFGALLVSVALCGQGFGFELLDNLLGLNRGGCGPCQPAACEPAAVAACDPACAACEPVAVAACEPACNACDPCGKPNCCRPRIRPVRDLFDGLEDLARCRLAGDCSKCKLLGPCKPACATACCEPAAVACCEPAAVACCEPAAVACCEPAAVACCEPAAVACDPACQPACDPGCSKKCCKPRCRPVLDLLENLFGRKCCPKPKKSCCGPMACAPAACGGCGGAMESATPAPTTEEAAPLPPAPKADPSASIIRPRQLHTASRTLAQY